MLRSRKTRIFAGIGLVLHGLGHAVFPLRGAGRLANSVLAEVIVHLAWGTAMVGFAAAGLGLMGARPLWKFWRSSTAVAVGASAVALASLRQLDLLPGALIDTLVLIAFYRVSRQDIGDTAAKKTSSPRATLMRAAGSLAAMSIVGYLAVCATTRSWHHRWGMTEDELRAALPADAPDRDPAFEVNHAITIDAPTPSVWPWLVQIGQDRGGFYSYDWLENLFGLNIHNADRIHAEWQDRAEGDLVRAAPIDWLGGAFGEDIGWRVTRVEPNRALVLHWWGAFVLAPMPGEKTRLFVRSSISDPKVSVWAAALSFATFELPHFIMERRMLMGIKARAERTGRDPLNTVPQNVAASP
jgi:hypothetical protein